MWRVPLWVVALPVLLAACAQDGDRRIRRELAELPAFLAACAREQTPLLLLRLVELPAFLAARAPRAYQPAAHPATSNGELVVLLHGIARTSRSMQPMAEVLTAGGYDVLNVGYPSREHRIEALASRVAAAVEPRAAAHERVHFVGFSMGGLVIRALLHRHRPPNLGRVVQIGPPNRGSEVADAFHEWFWYRKFYGPAGQQLVSALPRRESLLGPIDYELGVLAGACSAAPLFSLLLPGPDDGRVSVASTRVPGMRAHRTLPVSHDFLAGDGRVHAELIHFLAHGAFLPR